MSATADYIKTLARLKPGDLGLLRAHVGRGLDESPDAFDLFAGLWWPLRAKNEHAPRRETAWLIAKLYAFHPLEQSSGAHLARRLGRLRPHASPYRERFTERFDSLLLLPLSAIEPVLQWAVGCVASAPNGPHVLDWVSLTDDLSLWERESKRLKWVRLFLNPGKKGELPC